MTTTTTKKKSSVKGKALNRKKVKLKPQPKDLVSDCVMAIKRREFKEIMVFGFDEFTELFLHEAMKHTSVHIMFSDFDNNKLTQMNKILAKYNNSALRTSYVSKEIALKEAWATVLVFGSSATANQCADTVAELPYEEIYILEEF